MDEKLNKLYTALQSQYNLPDFETWKKSLDDPTRLEKAHRFAQEHFNNVGDINAFKADLFPVKKKAFNWDTGEIDLKKLSSTPAPAPPAGKSSPEQSPYELTVSSGYGQPFQERTQRAQPELDAYNSIMQRRGGNLTDDATVIQKDRIDEAKKLSMTPLEKQTLEQEKKLYEEAGIKDNLYAPVGQRASQEEFKAMSQVLANENKEIQLAIKKLQTDVMIGNDPERAQAEINTLQDLYQKNVDKYKEELASGKYKTVEDVQQYFQERQKEADKAQKEGSVAGNLARSAGRILLNSSAKTVQSLARLTDVVEKATGLEGKKPGFGDFVQEFAINTAEDLEAAFPAPTSLSRGVFTDTAKWGNKQVDFNPDGSIQSIRDKDGFVVDEPITKEDEDAIKALPKQQKFHREPFAYQAGSTIADVLVQIAGAKGLASLKVPVLTASRMGSVGVGLTEAGSNVGLIGANTAMMANQLYNEAKDAGFSDEEAARYSLATGVAIGAMGAELGLGIEAKVLGKGLKLPEFNFGTSVKGAIAKKLANSVVAGAGEFTEEAVTENIATAAIQSVMNATGSGHFDVADNFEKNKVLTEGSLGFIAGNLIDVATGKSINRLQMDAMIEGAKDVEKTMQQVKDIAAAKGIEITDAQEQTLRTKLEEMSDVVSNMMEEHLGNPSAVSAMAVKTSIDKQIQAIADTIEGKDPAMTQPQRDKMDDLKKQSDEAAIELAAATGIEPDQKAVKNLQPKEEVKKEPEKKMVKAGGLVEGQTYFSDETQREYIYRGEKDGMHIFEKVQKKGEPALMNTHIDAMPDSRFVKNLMTEEVADKAPSFDDSKVFEPIDEQSKPAGGRIFNEPAPDAVELEESMAKMPKGRPIFKLNTDRSKRIAEEFEKMQHTPDDPETKAAYEAMAKETMDQFEAIQGKGVTVEIYEGEGEPYKNSQEALDDLRNNKHLFVLSTEKEFGDEPISEKARQDNPLLRDSGAKDVNGKPLLVNDVFRFVHDFFGHGARGNSFGPVGEENAWDVHARMFSPLARRAMTTETRGQNSWVNFSGKNDAARKAQKEARKLREQGKNEEADKLLADNPFTFAPQKIGLLPEWVSEPYAEPVAQQVVENNGTTPAPSPLPPSLKGDGLAMPIYSTESGVSISSSQKKALNNLGYNDDQIDKMSNDEVNGILDKSIENPNVQSSAAVPPPTQEPPASERKKGKRKLRGFYENSIPKMEGKTPGQAVLAQIAKVSPQFYSKMSIKGEADAISQEIDEHGLDAVVQMAISPPADEDPVKTMARRVVSLLAIGNAIASANADGDVQAVDIMSQQAETLERLIAERGTTAGQENAFIAFYSMTPEGTVARMIRKVSKTREAARSTQNESGEQIGKVVDDIASEVGGIDISEEVKQAVEKSKAKVQAVKKSSKDVEAAKKKLEEARAKLSKAVSRNLNVGIGPAVFSALRDLFKAHLEVIGANIGRIKSAYLKDVESLGLSEKDAWDAVKEQRESIEKIDSAIESVALGFFKGDLAGTLSDAFKGAGLTQSEADAMAAEMQANMGSIVDAKVRSRLSTIVRKYEKSEKKARLIENGVLEAIVLGGINDSNIKKAIEEKYGIKSFSTQEVAELNEMVRDAKDLPSDRLKKQRMIEIMDYIQRRGGEDPIDIIHSFWFASVLSDIKTWGTVAVGNIGNFFNQYLYYGMLTEAGRFAMKESAYRLFNPMSQAGIWFGISELGEFVRNGSGFKSQDKIMRSSTLERVSRTQYTTTGMRSVSAAAKVARYSGRIMSAVDAVMFYSAFDFNMERIAFETAQAEGFTGKDAEARARELMGRSRQAMDAKAVIAKKELSDYAASRGKTFEEMFTERDVTYRVREMAMEAIDRAGGSSSKAQLLAEEVALQNDARGMWGAVAKFIGGNFPQVFDTKNIKPTGNKLLDSVVRNSAKALKVYSGFMFPFMKTAANMINMSVDFVPGLGMLQKMVIDNSLSSVTSGKVAPTLDWSNLDDRQVFLARQVTGAILVMLLGAAFGGDDDDMYITAEGPTDFNKRAQMYERGWRPFTVRMNGKNFYYRDSPLAIVLAYLGAQNDHRKWNSKNDEPMQFGDSVMAAMFAYLTNASFLQTLNDLTSSFQESNSSKIKIALTRPLTGFTNPGVARMVDRWVSPELRDSKTIEDRWLASVTANTMVVNNMQLELKYNSIGDPIDPYKSMGMFQQVTGLDRYVSPGTPTSDVFEVLAEKNVFFPKVYTNGVKHIDGTLMTYQELRDYSLIIAKYRGVRHKPNVAKMRMMSTEQLEDKLKSVDEEGKAIAKMLLFENRGTDLTAEKIDALLTKANVEDAKKMKKKIAKSMGKKEAEAEMPKDLNY